MLTSVQSVSDNFLNPHTEPTSPARALPERPIFCLTRVSNHVLLCGVVLRANCSLPTLSINWTTLCSSYPPRKAQCNNGSLTLKQGYQASTLSHRYIVFALYQVSLFFFKSIINSEKSGDFTPDSEVPASAANRRSGHTKLTFQCGIFQWVQGDRLWSVTDPGPCPSLELAALHTVWLHMAKRGSLRAFWATRSLSGRSGAISCTFSGVRWGRALRELPKEFNMPRPNPCTQASRLQSQNYNRNAELPPLKPCYLTHFRGSCLRPDLDQDLS